MSVSLLLLAAACVVPIVDGDTCVAKGGYHPCDSDPYGCDHHNDGLVGDLSAEQLVDELEHSLEIVEGMPGSYSFSCVTDSGVSVNAQLDFVSIDRSLLTQWSTSGEGCELSDEMLIGPVEASLTTSLGEEWSVGTTNIFPVNADGPVFDVFAENAADVTERADMWWIPDGTTGATIFWSKPDDTCTWTGVGPPLE